MGCSKAIHSFVSEYSITQGAQGILSFLFSLGLAKVKAANILAADSNSHRTATDELASIKALSSKASPSIAVLWTPFPEAALCRPPLLEKKLKRGA